MFSFAICRAFVVSLLQFDILTLPTLLTCFTIFFFSSFSSSRLEGIFFLLQHIIFNFKCQISFKFQIQIYFTLPCPFILIQILKSMHISPLLPLEFIIFLRLHLHLTYPFFLTSSLHLISLSTISSQIFLPLSFLLSS